MQEKYKYLLKNTGILTISSFSSKLLAFFLLPLYTSVLSTDDYGKYDIVVTTLSVLIPALTINIVAGVMRFCMDTNYDKGIVFSIGLKYTSFSCLVFGVVTFIVALSHHIPAISSLELFIWLYFSTNVFHQFATHFSKGLERISDLAISGVLGTALSLLLNVLFLLVFHWGIRGFYLASIISTALTATYLCVRACAWKYIRFYGHKEYERKMLAYSAPTVATQLGWWLNSSFDKYMVAFLLGSAENGLLSVAYKLPSVIHTVYNVFSPAWEISAIKEIEQENVAHFYSTVFSYLNAVLCIACSCSIVCIKGIARILFAKEFFTAWRYVPFLLLSAVLTSNAGFLGAILTANKNTKSLAQSTVFGAVINIILNFVLIKIWGTVGATLASVFSGYAIFAFRRFVTGGVIFKHILVMVSVAWFALGAQSVLMIYTDLYFIQYAFLFAIVMLFFKPLSYLTKYGASALRRRR